MRTIYIHIGAPKTGTSALQVFFEKNRRVLLENGLLYCNTGITKESGHAKLAWNLMGINFDETIDDNIWNELLTEINHYNGDILLSSEFFWILSHKAIKKLKDMLPEFNIKIIVYLRRQDEWAMANAIQEVKIYNKKWSSIDKLINSILKNAYYYPILKKWNTICSEDNIIVRPYEKEQFYQGNIFTDFMYNCLGYKMTDEYELPEKDINPRLSRDALEYKLIVNNLPIKKHEKNSILETLYLYSKDIDPNTQKPFQDHMLLSPDKRNSIINKFEKDNEQVAKKFMGRRKLFYASLPKSDTDWEQYNGLDINTTLEISKNIIKNKYSFSSDEVINEKLNKAIIKGVMSEFLNEPMLLNLEKSNSVYNEFKYNNAETIYTCPLKELEKYSNQNDMNNILLKNDGLHIEVIGPDPILNMPYFTKKVKNRTSFLVKISITVPVETEVELFYGIIDSKGNNVPYSAKRRINYPVNKGYNVIYIDINADGIINRLRLDPGKISGQYILHEFEARE